MHKEAAPGTLTLRLPSLVTHSKCVFPASLSNACMYSWCLSRHAAHHGAAVDHVGHDQVLPQRQQQRRPYAQHQRARAAVLRAEPAGTQPIPHEFKTQPYAQHQRARAAAVSTEPASNQPVLTSYS